MKTFFRKLKASLALDRGSKNQPGAARSCEESFQAMDRDLRKARTREDLPPNLHGGIMRAVRNSTVESEPSLVAVFWPRVAVMALVLVVGGAAYWSLNRKPAQGEVASSTEASSPLVAAIEQGHALTQTAPGAALRPLSGELQLLNDDLQKAMNVIVASVP